MIQVNEPTLSKNAARYVMDCVKTGWVSSVGKYIERFEQQFAGYIGTKYAVTTTSGTAALHLALAGLGIGSGDEVIVPDLTIISCAVAPMYIGAKPVFVDVDSKTATIDPAKIEEKITRRTKAIMPVHLYGYSADMDPIRKIAKKHKLFIVEDAAEAIGVEYKGKKVGSLSDASCFSFYANKLITTGEGGMITTNNEKLYIKLQSLKNLAHAPERRFLHKEFGFNYRLTNLQAALGVAQLEDIDKYITKKKRMYNRYMKGLRDIPYLELPEQVPWATYVCWMFTIVLSKNSPLSKQQVMDRLKKLGVDTREYFIPMHRQPILQKLRIVTGKEPFPVSDSLSERGFYIPSGLAITQKQMDTVIAALHKVFN